MGDSCDEVPVGMRYSQGNEDQHGWKAEYKTDASWEMRLKMEVGPNLESSETFGFYIRNRDKHLKYLSIKLSCS
jgi:hypothetical protein